MATLTTVPRKVAPRTRTEFIRNVTAGTTVVTSHVPGIRKGDHITGTLLDSHGARFAIRRNGETMKVDIPRCNVNLSVIVSR